MKMKQEKGNKKNNDKKLENWKKSKKKNSYKKNRRKIFRFWYFLSFNVKEQTECFSFYYFRKNII